MKILFPIRTTPGVAAVALAALAGAAFASGQPAVRVTPPERGDVVRYVTLPGTVRPNQQATLYAKVSGYLKTIAVDRGDEVSAGQVLGEIEVPELLAEVSRYHAELSVAQVEFDRAVEAQKRAPDLVLPQAFDNARARLAVAKANIERTETLLGYARLAAPFAGTITARYVDAGAFIPAATGGSAAHTAAVVTIMDFNSVRIQIAVPEREAVHVRKGQPVRFTADALPGREFEAAVTRFGYALDAETQTMLVEADVINGELLLRPGMFVTAHLGVETHSDVPRVPIDAVLFEKTGAAVFLFADGKAMKTPVKSGFNDGAHVEIASGINESARIIRFGKTPLSDGQPVVLQP